MYVWGSDVIIYKTEQEMDIMKRAGALAFALLDLAEQNIQDGVSTGEICDLIHRYTLEHDAVSAPLGYRGFPQACCISVNEVVCHGIPQYDHVLKTGDIVNVDVSPILDGFHADTSRTFIVGEAHDTAQRLVRCARSCLDAGIAAVYPGGWVRDIAKAITTEAKRCGFSVVKDFVGHGTGRSFHEAPNIQHCYDLARRQPKISLKKGMTFTIEPMINEGSWHTKILEDGWTAVTVDGKLSAQFEHTLGIRHDGRIDILTLPE